jgi:hypothetical protein
MWLKAHRSSVACLNETILIVDTMVVHRESFINGGVWLSKNLTPGSQAQRNISWFLQMCTENGRDPRADRNQIFASLQQQIKKLHRT